MIREERLRLDKPAQRRSLLVFKERESGKAEPYRTVRRQSRAAFLPTSIVCALLFSSACGQGVRRSGIPAGAQTALDTSIEDIDAGSYDKVYSEASDEWRSQTTLDESKATFQRLREKLGSVRTRTLQTAREEQTGTAPVAGHSVTAIYQATFDRGEATETFTLVERGGRWYLAKYYVSSSGLR